MVLSTGIVSIIGLMRGWETSAQYSDGFFWAGAILILIGFISFRGYSYSSTGGLPAKMDSGNRANLWAADAFSWQDLFGPLRDFRLAAVRPFHPCLEIVLGWQ